MSQTEGSRVPNVLNALQPQEHRACRFEQALQRSQILLRRRPGSGGVKGGVRQKIANEQPQQNVGTTVLAVAMHQSSEAMKH